VKIFFFEALNFLTDKKISTYPFIFYDTPTQVYLGVKSYYAILNPESYPFFLDFSNNESLNSFAILLGKSTRTKWLFHYLTQLLILDSSWLHIHLYLVIR
jgi:hypothetical protein